MSSARPTLPPPRSAHLSLLRAVDAGLRARVDAPPAMPQHWPVLLARAREGLDTWAPCEELILAAQGLRDALYGAPGHERQGARIWREAIATAYFAAGVARAAGMSPGVATMAGLLHRCGEAELLQVIAAAERACSARLDVGVRGRIARQAPRQLASGLLRAWQVPADAAAVVLGWQQMGEFGAVSRECMALHVGHQLATEHLYPDMAPAALLDGRVASLGIAASLLPRLRSDRAGLESLVQAFG